MLKSRVLRLAICVICFAPISASAAPAVVLDLVYDGSFDDGFNPVSYSLSDVLTPGQVSPSDIHQFSIYFQVTDLPNGAGLQYLALDGALGPGLATTLGGYSGNLTDSFDPPPAGPANGGLAPLFSTNLDAGSSSTDLLRITAITNRAQAIGIDPGGAAPYLMGNILVTFDGLSSTSLSVQNASGDVWLYWPNGSDPAVNAGATVSPASFDITVVPEPQAIALIMIGSISLLGARRWRRVSACRQA